MGIQTILSGNATTFASMKWRPLLENMIINVYHCSSCHPAWKSNERGLRDMTTYLRIMCNKNHKNWFKVCSIIENMEVGMLSKVLTGKRPLKRPRRRWEQNIKMDLKEMCVWGRGGCEDIVNTVNKHCVGVQQLLVIFSSYSHQQRVSLQWKYFRHTPQTLTSTIWVTHTVSHIWILHRLLQHRK